MLIWINGAFGAGKTQTAHELCRRTSGTRVSDPEVLGFALGKMLPPGTYDDFQDIPQWRSGIVDTLQQAEEAADGPVIVPMTIIRDDYFDEIVGGLRGRGVEVRHYTLSTTPETLRKRLRSRLSTLRGFEDTWALSSIDRCVTALSRERYGTHVPTDDLSIDEVVEWIARDADLPLTRPRMRPARYQARRLAVGIRHIRI